MPLNWDLKSALVEKIGSQVVAARAMGIRESRLSYLIRGHALPSEQEREALEHVLGSALVSKLLHLP